MARLNESSLHDASMPSAEPREWWLLLSLSLLSLLLLICVTMCMEDNEGKLEKKRATHSRAPAWEIPTEEPGGLLGVTRAGHDLATKQP